MKQLLVKGLLLSGALLGSACVAVNTKGYNSSTSIHEGEVRLYPIVSGKGRAKDIVPLAAYAFEGPPYRAGVKVVDHGGTCSQLQLNRIVLSYIDSGEVLFSSSDRVVTEFATWEGGGASQSAFSSHDLGRRLDPANAREISMEVEVEVFENGRAREYKIETTFRPSTESGLHFLPATLAQM